VVRSLADHLTALFRALLDGADQPSLDVQLVAEYRYTINPEQGNAPLTIAAPILMQPPLVVATAEGAPAPSLATMIADLAAAITGWFSADPPASNDGTLGFVLTVLTTLTTEPRPLITLSRLSLSLTDIYPPLPVSDTGASPGRRLPRRRGTSDRP
jgi:hypothetical protein